MTEKEIHPLRHLFPSWSDEQFELSRETIERGFGDLKAKRGRKKSLTSSLTDAVIKYVKLKGGAARRVNTQGQWVDARYENGVLVKGTGMWRKSGMKKGFEDISCIIPVNINGVRIGRYLAVEVKVGHDKMSPEQIKRKEEVEKAGGLYYECRDIESFMKYYDEQTNITY